ncbi:MAG TPA: DnaA/Hda family protein [Nitrospinota bacterium]|nr:DnaA/Hda family protein [Nitrospinota bacterium]|tara:strand:+ start:86376 stop:87248 length:873 start_codon:yes stop_codon:yes gene_type:complete
MSQLKFPFPKNRKDRFENFAIDEKNAKAVMLCKAFSNGSSEEAGSLVIHGDKGCGKTHMLAAMGNLAKKCDSTIEAMYLDCIDIKNSVAKASTYEELKEWITGFEGASFLTFDNMHELSDYNTIDNLLNESTTNDPTDYGDCKADQNAHLLGDASIESRRKKRKIEEAQYQVFHLYNAVVQNGGRIAVATQEFPSSWKFPDWLSTRLLWGFVTNLKPVGDEMRIDVLNKISRDLGMILPESAANWMLTHLPRDPASQLNFLEKIDQHSLTLGRKVSISLVKQALEYADER